MSQVGDLKSHKMLSRMRTAATAAREKGALKSIETTQEVVTSNPPFLIRVLKNLSQKSGASNNSPDDATASASKPKFNPFLPYDPSMFVQDLPPKHVLLLNKFNVVEDHTLIVTSEFEEQSSLLNPADFSACWICLVQIRGLVFYNAGRIAGASQRHKHLQHIAGPLIAGDEGVTPFDSVINTGKRDGEIYMVKELEFLHGVVGMKDVFSLAGMGLMREAGVVTMQRYTDLLRMVGNRVGDGDVVVGEDVRDRQPFAYNLVMTRDWMMVVPRRMECFDGISVNSLGFVGCLLVRDETQKYVVKNVGGMTVLREVGFTIEESE